jgi:hypothetical protein
MVGCGHKIVQGTEDYVYVDFVGGYKIDQRN